MPLPLYGSGGRTLRISAAVCPTICLSMPLTMISVGVGTSKEMPARGVIDDRMRVADGELEVLAAERGAVADALDLQALLEALRDALDHVRDQRTREPVERAVGTAVARPRDDDRVVLLLDLHPQRHLLAELAERAR